jgi:hypothetical protein
VKFVKDKSFVLLEAMETLLRKILEKSEMRGQTGRSGGDEKQNAASIITRL